MKKCTLLLVLLYSFSPVYLFAASGESSQWVTVEVTESVPGANCTPKEGAGGDVTKRKYECTVQGGFGTVQKMLGGLIKYATFITALLGVLMVVFSGLQYATSSWDSEAQKSAIGRITSLIGWLILLFLVGLILNTIAPWIYG